MQHNHRSFHLQFPVQPYPLPPSSLTEPGAYIAPHLSEDASQQARPTTMAIVRDLSTSQGFARQLLSTIVTLLKMDIQIHGTSFPLSRKCGASSMWYWSSTFCWMKTRDQCTLPEFHLFLFLAAAKNKKNETPWRFIIHAAIDYSRLVSSGTVSDNTRASTVLFGFQQATRIWGIPVRVRSDNMFFNFHLLT